MKNNNKLIIPELELTIEEIAKLKSLN